MPPCKKQALPYNCAMNTPTTLAIRKACDLVGGKAALARLLGVKPPTVQQWANGARPVAVDRCVAIERATKGAVSRIELRPDDGHLIWPEIVPPTEAKEVA
ncbi:transcriptional regulator [Burkholderia alba]|uniref:transcriptional regulator n=1 Tax=Burkholderia alba TaxID=2683677 RepID=UPI002B05C0E8|nr:helix-turn-helix domain-containing protein [Burkholderia alba]